MHYRSNAFAIDPSRNTITARDANAAIGQRDGASERDIDDIRSLYQCLNGPRSVQQSERDPCTDQCKCWEGATGCNGNDEACQGDLGKELEHSALLFEYPGSILFQHLNSSPLCIFSVPKQCLSARQWIRYRNRRMQ